MSTTNIAKDWLLEKGCMILKINERSKRDA